jgi:hypothetical protein
MSWLICYKPQAYIKILFVSPFRLSIVAYGSVGKKNILFFTSRIIKISDNKVHLFVKFLINV